MPTQIIVNGVTPTYKNVPRADVTPFYSAAAWVSAGNSFWGRGDTVDDSPSGAEFDILDRRPGSTRKFRQPSGQTDVTVDQAEGYLGGRSHIVMVDSDQFFDADTAVLPSTGEFAMYMAHHPTHQLADLFGAPGVTNALSTQMVNGVFRFAINSGTTTLQADTGRGSDLKNLDMIVGFIRQADGHIAIRYRLAGDTAWTEVVSGAAITNAITTTPRVGRKNTGSGSSYRLQTRWSDIILHSGAMSLDQRTAYENYLGGRNALN